MPEFKVITDIIPMRVSKKDFQPHEFEKKVNEHLNAGWRLVNCESIYLGGVSPRNGMHYWAYLVKD